ncbi:DUF6461 domain-containing protein [Streptomyces sp. NPDC094438]|uniref:DUF6461 domain-containing protein n=1 Tax=Streptomyces sp. NPDC094438 TaxID=3366061 RepID=UPI0038128371
MATPLDLTDMFGECWCVTLTRQPPVKALQHMGVDTPTRRPHGLDQASRRLTATPERVPPGGTVMLLAHQAGPGWTLIMELDGLTGWVGMREDVLSALSADGTGACSAMRDPNRFQILYAEAGRVLAGLDPTTGRRWGTPDDRLAHALTAAGFAADDTGEMTDELARWNSSQRTVAALHAATGVHLAAETFRDPWLGGLTTDV